MSSEQILIGLTSLATAMALWSAIFATRADRATRRAIKLADGRWEATTKPVPHLSFTGQATPVGQAIEVEIENLGGTVAAGGVIVQSGDDLYAGELTLPEKSSARGVSLQPVMKAWQRLNQPRTLLLVVRDVGGRCWDCVDGGKPIKDPRQWLAAQLRELRLQGVVDFPGVTGVTKR
jgi:hypothetical protein